MSKIPYDFNPFGKDGVRKPYGPSDGLVFYAPLEENGIEWTRGELSTSGSINFSTVNDLKALSCSSSQYGTLYTENQGKINDANIFSFSFWMKRAINNSFNGLFFEFGSSTRSSKKVLYLQDYNGIWIGLVGGQSTSFSSSSGPIPFGKWFHCVLVLNRTSGNVKLYLDGEYNTQKTFNDLKNFDYEFGKLAIGSNTAFSENWKNGYLCGFRIFNRELSSSEVYELYQEYIPKYQITASDQTFRFTPVENVYKQIVYTCEVSPSFEIISGSLPNTITLNSTNGKFYGKAPTDADHTYNLVVKMYGRNVYDKEINVTINTSATSDLTVPSPQSFTFINEASDSQMITINREAEETQVTVTEGTLPTGISIQKQGLNQFITSTGEQSSNASATIKIGVSSQYHPTPVQATLNIDIRKNIITIPNKSIKVYIDDGAVTLPIIYKTQNPITPVYSMTGTLPNGFTFDSTNGTISYDGVYSAPTSKSVDFNVNSSTGNSVQGTGTYSIELLSGSAPIPSGVWLYCPCKDASSFECENESVTMGKTGSPNFYTAAQEGRDCMEIFSVTNIQTSTYKNVYFDNCYTGNSIPRNDESRSVAYWIKFPSNAQFSTGHGQTIFDWGYGAKWQDFRNAIIADSASSPTQIILSTDNYNGLPPATYSVGTSTEITLTNVWSDYDWHLIVFTYDHDTHTWCTYLDGTLTAQCVFSQNLSTAYTRQGPLVIGVGSPSLCGHSKSAGNPSFRISDFRLWKRALTAAEVQKLVNA